MSENERKKRVAALLRERQGYVLAEKEDYVRQVDEQLRLYGYKRPVTEQEARKVPPQGRTAIPPQQQTVKK